MLFSKKAVFLLFASLSANTNTTTAPADDPENPKSRPLLDAFTFFTNIQPSQLNKSNAKNTLAPIIALHALEHFVCGNNHLGRKLTGDTNNPNRTAALSLWIVTKLAFHVTPAILRGNGFLQGIKSFINSGHVARMALVTPFRIHSENKLGYILSRLAALLLIANQFRLVNNVHKQVIRECKELGIEKPFKKAITEPSPTHVKLPRYLTQDFGTFMSQWFVHRLIYENHYKHFNKEFWDEHHSFWPERTPNPQLLQELKVKEYWNRPSTICSPLFSATGKLASCIYGGMVSMLANLILMLRERAKDANAIPGETNPKIINAVLDKNTFLWLEPYNLFISQETFKQLSHDLQVRITQLNDQELIFNTYNLTNPLTERAFALAQYTHKTEAEDFIVGLSDNLSPESIKKRVEKRYANEANFTTSSFDYEKDNLPRIQAWEKTGSFTQHFFSESDIKANNILNYKEQTLMNFIPINNTTTPKIRAYARKYAKEVFAQKPVSRLAKKVIDLTADLEESPRV